jgi:hypothetical protein
VSNEVYPDLTLGRLRSEPLLEGLVDLIMKLSIPESKLQKTLGFPKYPVYQSSLI